MNLSQLSDSTFHQLLEAAPDAIVISNSKGEIVLANHMTETVFGYAQQELVGKPIETLMPERFRENHPKHREAYSENLHTRPMGARLELFGMRKDGSEFPVEIALSPLKVDDSLLITAVVRDITRRHNLIKSIEEKALELEASNAELEQFAYVASHDLQEPLRMVASFAQLLYRHNKDTLDKDSLEYINFLVDGAKRMQDLINDLLTYSRVGTHSGEARPVDAEAVMKTVLSTLALSIEESRANVSFDPLPHVLVDEIQLGQVFQNMIGNAIKFRGKQEPRIHIGTVDQGDKVEFYVRDNGIGMESAYLGRIFDIFQRLHSREVYAGTGIGLSICKKIIERHGGSIRVESEPGVGTIFYFTLIKAGELPAVKEA